MKVGHQSKKSQYFSHQWHNFACIINYDWNKHAARNLLIWEKQIFLLLCLKQIMRNWSIWSCNDQTPNVCNIIYSLNSTSRCTAKPWRLPKCCMKMATPRTLKRVKPNPNAWFLSPEVLENLERLWWSICRSITVQR